MDVKWHNRFVELATHVASWSKQEKQVGAVLVDPARRVAGVGYNGPNEGFDDSKVTPENSDYVVVHAEVNALINSRGHNLTMFVNSAPCTPCAASIAASGLVVKVVCPAPSPTGRWSLSQEEGIRHLKSRGVEVEFV